MGGRGRVVVVGAGMSGLVAARVLSPHHDVVVVDKGRGVGGRMATRRIAAATLDHGAQFVTAKGPEMTELVAEWRQAGVVSAWFEGPGRHTRFRGVPAMTAPARSVAQGLDVRTATRIESVTEEGSGWVVTAEGGARMVADAVVLTAPAPQSLEMVDRGGVALSDADRRVLDDIRYEPCLAVLAPLDGPSGLPEPGLVLSDDDVVDTVVDNQLKGISTAPALTVHATVATSRAMWDRPDDEITGALLGSVAVASAPRHDVVQVMRWRYARAVGPADHLHLRAAGVAPLVVAGDGFGGPSVEGAVRSGRSAAVATLELLSR